MSRFEEFAFMDAIAQAEMVRRGEVKPVELVEAAIERTELLNPKLNAVVTKMYEHAQDAAKGSLPNGPFRGVPFLLKDLQAAYAGVRMTFGSRFLRDFVPGRDTELVTRHKRSGLVILGKTNTPEFGILPTTEPLLFGTTHNPWNVDRSAGGSSGGSAAAVAAGIVPIAHANDGGGSIRIPASCCGLFGLKPTRARNPLGPEVGDVMGGLVAEHALTRSVRDSAALLDATAGPDVGDPYWAPPPLRPYAEEVKCDPGRLQIAFSTKAPSGAKIHPDCVNAVLDVAKLCAELGHEVTEAAPEINGPMLVQAFTAVWAAGSASGIDAFAFLTGQAPQPEQFEPLTWGLYEMGKKVTGPAYLLAQMVLQRITRDVARFMEKYDAWLTPTLAEPPVPLGTFDSTPDNPLRGFYRAVDYVPFTPIANATGQPAMSVPLYWNSEGLPVGTHFFGRFGDEGLLFRLAAQLERARPWTDRRPAIHA
ncbi:MAG: amidase family protein [Acidobacteria bacterium]|nr:amidase family protein [Acidobacteriota bacterium]